VANICNLCLIFNVGLSWEEKFRDVRERMTEKEVEGLVVTNLEQIACKSFHADI